MAITRDDSDSWGPPGYGTPFYIGDVVAVESLGAGAAGASSSVGDAYAGAVTVHYRMPELRGQFCDELARPFHLVCMAMHQWTRACESRRQCVRSRPEGATTSRMTARIEAETIFEANIQLNSSGAISLKSKRALAETNPAWAAGLGVRVSAEDGEPDQKARGAKRRRK